MDENNSTSATRVFLSYSHKDKEQKDQVKTCLKALPPGIEVKVWEDTRMLAGDIIDDTIFQEIDRTDVFLVLVSRNYLASAYCRDEMKTALLHAEERGCRVVPVIVRPNVAWREYPIGQKLALPPDGRAPTDWKHEDQHWAAVETGLIRILSELHTGHPRVEDESYTETRRHSDISQGQIETADNRGFHTKLKTDLTKSLSNDMVRPLLSILTGDQSQPSPDSAVNHLLEMEPLDSIRRWTEITASWFKNLNPTERGIAWGPVRDVHLNLLPRLIDPDWIENWRKNSCNAQDKRLLTVLMKPRSPNRAVEVLVARVDSKYGAVRFHLGDDVATAQAHPGQINTDNEALRGMQKPTPEEAVQRLGRYLLARYNPKEEPPDVLRKEDWEDLNDDIVERPVGGWHYYYLVIPEDDPDYGNDVALLLLYEKMPNLPRVLLSSERGASPLTCRQNRLEKVIDAFWDIKRMEFA